jgi:LytS/YehU family sensor histidine kinase
MPKIIIIDDEVDQEELILQRFSQKSFLQGYSFITARTGKEALHTIQNDPDIEIALLDINMPGMDGLTLLELIPAINPVLTSIIISAYSDMSNIKVAMNRGAFDFITKPIDFPDLEATLKKTIAHIAQLKDNVRISKENSALIQKSSVLEMNALRAQMNPHFIFNSLNSINNFILQNDTNQASEYLIKFSKLIRLILEHSNFPLISIGQELDALKLYIELESLRFENKFKFEVNLSDDLDTTSIKVPTMILQPLIENSIHHGFRSKKESGLLILSINEKNESLIISVKDNGIGRKQAQAINKTSDVKHRSMGMSVTKQRIELMDSKNGDANMKIIDLKDATGTASGTEIIIQIPLII